MCRGRRENYESVRESQHACFALLQIGRDDQLFGGAERRLDVAQKGGQDSDDGRSGASRRPRDFAHEAYRTAAEHETVAVFADRPPKLSPSFGVCGIMTGRRAAEYADSECSRAMCGRNTRLSRRCGVKRKFFGHVVSAGIAGSHSDT